ncbi:hypothetical protein ILUMI_05295 [Ignelater luminosus]|uniref:Serpin domain-containing protein n=1 Tax=Ignelater luminosus TaxID=2038154 RepID=A0A8K0D7D0_IGNLU|nr:hypothetical protein ILUMI_05295 [Ignelater luminosus]
MTSATNVSFLGLTIALVNKVKSAKPIIQKLIDKPNVLQSRPGNFLVCPLSIEIILALAQIGARGKTSKEISAALQLPHEPDRIQLAFLELSQYFQHNDEYKLNSVNKVYIKNGSKIDDQFKLNANTFFGADIQDIDFQKSEEASDIINKWIAQTTTNKMTNILSKESFDENTRLILINSTVFQGRSNKEFRFESVNKKPFFLNDEDYVDVIMLESMGYFNYNENPEMQARFLELPYEGDDVVTTIVLPNEKTGLAKLEVNIAEYFVAPEYTMQHVHVQIPKSTIDTVVRFDEILRRMGVDDALKDCADFSGMCDGKEKLKIKHVLHKTVLDIEEVKAKSDVSDILAASSNPAQGALLEPIRFHADHPFLFYLKHKATGVVFVGRFYSVDGVIKKFKNESKTESRNMQV